MPQVSVVIPSYNRRESVLALLGDLYQQQGADFEVIVVDDCSPDHSPAAIAAAFPQATLLVNETNGGPCVTRNKGILAARGQIIVGLDSDVRVPDPTLLARVLSTLREMPPRVHGLAFRLLQPDGVSEDKARWWHPLPIETYASQTFETSYFSGTGYAFRREAVIAAGLFPEILYMHYEEVELAYRILDSQGAILYAPLLAVVHHASTSGSSRTRIQRFFKPRNQILIAMSCYPIWRGIFYAVPRVVYNLATAVYHGHFIETLRAVISACQLGPSRLEARKPLSNLTFRRMKDMRRA